MFPTFHSSGDLIADRRYGYAIALAEAGDPAAAADLIEQALELVPGWVPGWFALGVAREAAGAGAGALAAFRRAAGLDPDDRLGASLHAARLAGTTPPAPPAGYVRALFDAYAPAFEKVLTGRLGYRAPGLVASALAAAAPGRRFAAALDLGCGTGLMGAAIRERCDRLDGVDLSVAMAAEAEAKGLYDGIRVGEAVADLRALTPGSLDLVLAADVFCYLGDLAPVLGAAARALRPGGLLAFTVEQLAGGDADFALKDSLRYGHGQAYLRAVAADQGFDVLSLAAETLREDRGAPVGGLVAVLRRAGPDPITRT
ncbi:class I SAM-dependent DNA methyltransferase [Prosthecomicrobium sp. N25]|uniref:class I SAM-dependent DNA methyltransferase n=1 Tax=Prosthecomicrobium sp. N25 TaxID=3129254 RepID=UPI00307893C7